MSINIRKAVKSDMPAVLSMMQELDSYVNQFKDVPSMPKVTVDDLNRDGGFNDDDKVLQQSPLFHCFVAVDDDIDGDSKIVAYVLGSYLYNWSGKCFHMEDIYVKSSHRKLGVGEKMFKHLIEFVKNEKCDRIEFHMVKGNPAQRFYEKMKATNVTTSVGYQYYRLYNDAINSIVENQCI